MTKRAAPVLLLTQYLGLGGLERMILNLARGLRDTGAWAPRVFAYDLRPGVPSLRGELAASGIPVVALSKPGGFSPGVVVRLVAEILRHRVRVIHSHDLGALIYAVLAKLLCLGTVRVVHTQHSFIHLEKKIGRYRLYERFFSRFADELVTVSDGLRDRYGEVGIEPARVRVIPNGVEYPGRPAISAAERREARLAAIERMSGADPGAAEALRAALDEIWVLCMARIHPRKGQEHVAALWRRLEPARRAGARLVFVGQQTHPGALDSLRAAFAGLGDPSSAVYAGFTHRPSDWLLAADVYVSGSEVEGMPLGPLEALGSGLSTLVSEIPGHSMLPPAAARFSLDDPEGGARALAALIDPLRGDASESRARAWAGGREARERFGIPVMTERYRRLYAPGLAGILRAAAAAGAVLAALALACGLAQAAPEPGRDLPALRLRGGALRLERDASGRMTRLKLPDGDVVNYRYAAGQVDPLRERLVAAYPGSIRAPLGDSPNMDGSFLSPWRLPVGEDQLEAPAARIRADDRYGEFVAETTAEYLTLDGSRELSAEAIAALEGQLRALETCAPAAAGFLSRLLHAGRIRHSPGNPDAAAVDAVRESTIYLSTFWVRTLEGRARWNPLEAFFRPGDRDARALRERYFGSPDVTLGTLGKPSRDWILLFALLHEAGHVLQYEREAASLAKDVFAFDLYRVSLRAQSLAMFGRIPADVERSRVRLQRAFDLWKRSVESGATFFALDALAACSPSIDGGLAESPATGITGEE